MKMQSVKVLWRRRLLCIRADYTTTTLSSSSLINNVLVHTKASSRVAILNRPSSLNSLNTQMGALLHKCYRAWEDDPDIGFVSIKGSGRAFCAGGDIVGLYHLINNGKVKEWKEFFRTLYNFIYYMGTYLKPHVALLNGITMGGGGGISIPGTLRVATDRTNIRNDD